MKTNFALRNNVSAVTYHLLKSLKVKVNFASLDQLLGEHPEEGSLLAVVDCLAGLNIQTEIYNIPAEDYSREDLVYPFLAHLKTEDKFIVIKSIADDIFIYGDENSASNKMPESQFLSSWSGIALTAIVGKTSGEQAYMQNKIAYTLKSLLYPSFALLFGLILMNTLYFSNQPASVWLATLIRIIGAALTAMLIGKALNISSGFLDKVCSVSGEKGCDELLSSSASKITSWLSWSEVGFFYFSGSLLLMLNAPGQLPYLALLNALSVPFSVYLIAYQFRNKTWCVVCCIIQTLIFLQFSLDYILGSFNIQPVNVNWSVTVSCFSAPILFWALIKPIVNKAGSVNYLRFNLNKFKFDPEIFQKLLESQQQFGISEEVMPLQFGNINAKHVVTLVTNPTCSSCAQAHETVFSWLKLKRDICVQILFATSDQNLEARRIASYITVLYKHKGPEFAEEAMTAWFNKSEDRPEEWETLFPLNDLHFAQQRVLQQKKWCQDQGIDFTPALLVNGYALPKQYTPNDLRFIID